MFIIQLFRAFAIVETATTKDWMNELRHIIESQLLPSSDGRPELTMSMDRKLSYEITEFFEMRFVQ